MQMTNAEYRRRVFMTLSQKPAKDGLRRLAQNQKQVNVHHCVTGLSTEMGEVYKALRDYITGASQLTDSMRKEAFEEMGDLLYYVFALAHTINFKLPALTKKSRLKGLTMTEALVDLNILAGDMLDMAKKTYYGPATYKNQTEDGKKIIEHKDLDAMLFDKDGQKEVYEKRNATVKAHLDKFVPILWALIYELFHETPQVVASGNSAKLAERYPDGFFDRKAQESRDTETELEAMEAGAQASK